MVVAMWLPAVPVPPMGRSSHRIPLILPTARAKVDGMYICHVALTVREKTLPVRAVHPVDTPWGPSEAEPDRGPEPGPFRPAPRTPRERHPIHTRYLTCNSSAPYRIIRLETYSRHAHRPTPSAYPNPNFNPQFHRQGRCPSTNSNASALLTTSILLVLWRYVTP